MNYYHQSLQNSKHFNCQQPVESYKCDLCDFETHFSVFLSDHSQVTHQLHLKIKTDSFQDGYKCGNCGLKTFSLLILLKHSCQCCEEKTSKPKTKHKRFSSKNKCNNVLNNSTPSLHEKVRWYKCKHCSYKTSKLGLLKSHLADTQLTKKSLQCQKCDFVTNWKCNFNMHLSKTHFDIYLFECKHCSFTTKTQTLLNKHVHAKHENYFGECRWVEWFECDVCGFRTRKMKKLEEHTVVKHTKWEDIKWYECEYCSYRGKLEHYVKAHVRNHHQYTHSYCNTPFRFEF